MELTFEFVIGAPLELMIGVHEDVIPPYHEVELLSVAVSFQDSEFLFEVCYLVLEVKEVGHLLEQVVNLTYQLRFLLNQFIYQSAILLTEGR